MSDTQPSDFKTVAIDQPGATLLGEFWYFLRYRKKWWLLPILALLLFFQLFILLSGTGLAPFIYTLF